MPDVDYDDEFPFDDYDDGPYWPVPPRTRDDNGVLVACEDFVRYVGEDGPYAAACGGPLVGPEFYACEGHTAEREGWLALSEFEKAAWERRHDQENP